MTEVKVDRLNPNQLSRLIHRLEEVKMIVEGYRAKRSKIREDLDQFNLGVDSETILCEALHKLNGTMESYIEDRDRLQEELDHDAHLLDMELESMMRGEDND